MATPTRPYQGAKWVSIEKTTAGASQKGNKMVKSGKKWFEAQGRSARSRGLRLQECAFFRYRNDMPYWAWIAYTEGYDKQRKIK